MSYLKKTGIVSLPLHYGKAPSWLVIRMQSLAREIIKIIINEYGQKEFLVRLSDPLWFQALGCVLGYDWHSSGVTTVVTGVLKSVLKPKDFGIAAAGGKGRFSTRAQDEIAEYGKVFDLAEEDVCSLQYASRMSAKVDNAAIQSGYPLYHHVFFLNETGKWVVIQQGMNIKDKTARRYHWLSDQISSFVVEPHKGIVCDVIKKSVLDMTAKVSEDSRKASVDLANEGSHRIKRTVFSIQYQKYQTTLERWVQDDISEQDFTSDFLYMPWTINWKALERAYELQPKNYEELLSIRGIGPSTVRGLALVSEIIYGQSPSWRDPAKYSFAYGGKDGIPFPVDRKSMDRSIQFLREAIEQSKIGDKEKLSALKRLGHIASKECATFDHL